MVGLSWEQYKQKIASEANDLSLKQLQSLGLYHFIQEDKNKINLSEFISTYPQEEEQMLFEDAMANVINNIEEILEGGVEKIRKNAKKRKGDTEIKALEKELEVLTKNLQDFCKQIKESPLISSKFSKEISALEEAINSLGNKTKRNAIANKIVKKEEILTDNTGKQLFRSLGGISSAIKGGLLEYEASQYISEKFEKLDENLIAVQTGQFKVGGIDIKEDIMIFGKDTWEQIEKDFSDKKTISLTVAQYSDLQAKAKTAISAKAAKGNITFHKGISDPTLEAWGEINSMWAVQGLRLANQIFNKGTKEEEKESLRNYIISKNVNRVIGEKNKWFLHRNQLTSTYDYLYKMIVEEGKLLKHYKGDIQLK